jgi:(1->4)-alpha-D-glucan 1-alpha-D-glucosylmutase
MSFPTSTYRIQFRNGQTFDRVAEAVPYLKNLGISHLYASPIFTATKGSTHGYDVTNCNEIDPDIGGREGFDRLSATLKEAGLGLIIDIVPNHMAASTENAWWADILKFGETSAYANYFDIDWRERVTLPILGKAFDDALADGEFALRQDGASGDWFLAYHDTLLPLAPETTNAISHKNDPARIKQIYDAQHWQLTHWQDAAKHLSYRRFFEVTGLVGLCVEDKTVFDDTHRLILDLVHSGQVQGLRLDHIDGLAAPGAYLDRLRKAVGEDVFITVEKILGHGETLPSSWPVEGTTGYEFISALSNVFVDPQGLDVLGAAYAGATPEHADFATGLRAAKKLMVEQNFQGEVARLVNLAKNALPQMEEAPVAEAIRELLIAFPVYRTYGEGNALSEEQAAVLRDVTSAAAEHVKDRATLDAIAALLHSGSQAEFQTRFQQVSGPVMAKAMEDTLFYRFNRLLATNEVGGEPNVKPGGIETFHALMLERLQTQPHGLSATATHDTKRGEDTRARLYVISENAAKWQDGFETWRTMNRKHQADLSGKIAPDTNVEWMLYQALVGIWPDTMINDGDSDLVERFTAYAEKAVREAKISTSWNDKNPAFEEALNAYATALLDPANMPFSEDFGKFVASLRAAGHLNSLSQTLIKLTAPGIPDIYQGTEALDFSLVDPDNRRPVDMKWLADMLEQELPLERLPVPATKQRIVQTGLTLRNQKPELFSKGLYIPLSVSGTRKDHVLAFARHHGQDVSITVVPLRISAALKDGMMSPGPEFWGDTAIVIPREIQAVRQELFIGQSIELTDVLDVSRLLGRLPCALLN